MDKLWTMRDMERLNRRRAWLALAADMKRLGYAVAVLAAFMLLLNVLMGAV